jgi:Protein of unknown function (DUF4232)
MLAVVALAALALAGGGETHSRNVMAAPPAAAALTAPCVAGDLRPVDLLEGGVLFQPGGGLVYGTVRLRNVSRRACRLSGWPRAELLNDQGEVVMRASRTQPLFTAARARLLRILRPGRSAYVGLQLANPCAYDSNPRFLPRPTALRLTLPRGRRRGVLTVRIRPVPWCVPAELPPQTLAVEPFVRD